MKRNIRLIVLLACFFFYSVSAGISVSDTAFAAPQDTKESPQNDTANIYGKVTDVIATDSFTFVEVDTGKGKVWAAAPVTPVSKDDMIAFSARTPMQNFHSKSLGRDFAVIYFVSSYITDKEILATPSPHDQTKQQQISKLTTTIAGTPGEVGIGGYLREVTLDGLNGQAKKFSDFEGKPLIINIWASWCGPCRAEMGSLEQLAQRYNGKEFNIIGISTDDYRTNAEAFIEQTEISFENFLDHKLLLENMLGANTIPLTILVDADGRVLHKVRGSREWDSPEIISAIGEVFHIKLMH
ncbi:MAG: TlpA disulfide reductase family protein [Gammaproteobacteria bacterium]